MSDGQNGNGAGADRAPIDLQDVGRTLLGVMYGALRALKFYPIDNEVTQQTIDDLHRVATAILSREGLVELRVVGDFFFLNETRLRLDLRNFSTFGSFARALREHKIGEVVIDRGVERQEWAPFLSLLLRPGDEEEPFETFVDRLEGTEVSRMEVRPEREAHQIDLESEVMEGAKRTYAYSVQMARDLLSDMRMGKAVTARKVKRAVQSIVDQVLADEPSIIAMTTLREFDEYTFTHCVNVCIFAVVIGQRIGLDKAQLYELGLGALFHDVGKTRVDEEVLNKAGALDDEEWQQLLEHPTEGLLALFRLHGFLNVPYRQMLMAYEHHMKMDLSGYPSSRRPREIGLFSRIVAVADAFDAATSVRSYQYEPWPPDEVLREMRDNPERGLDTVLVKALMTATGVYPVGTLVILDTFELAVVTRANSDPQRLHQPEVKILSDSMGVPLAEPVAARLDEKDPGSGEFKRAVIKTADPTRYDVRVADYVTT
ncbi:MAG: HD domain-containing phosphohydrolase [Gemmatimonadota bacterium]